MAKISEGMLCWLTHCRIPENEGKVVTVLSFHGPLNLPGVSTDRAWNVHCKDVLRGVNALGVCPVSNGEFIAAEWQLVPINDPDAQLDDVRDLALQE